VEALKLRMFMCISCGKASPFQLLYKLCTLGIIRTCNNFNCFYDVKLEIWNCKNMFCKVFRSVSDVCVSNVVTVTYMLCGRSLG
jgi:hypothetical protein